LPLGLGRLRIFFCSWRNSRRRGWGDGWRRGENLIEIERSVFGGVFEAECDLVVCESRLGIRSILGLKLAGAQSGLDGGAQFAADAIEIARDARFVFAEFAADVGEGLLVGVVEAEALAVARIERVEGFVEGVGEECEIARAVGVGSGVVRRVGEVGGGIDGSDAFPKWNCVTGNSERGSGLRFLPAKMRRCRRDR
jgi:hypothetical protein